MNSVATGRVAFDEVSYRSARLRCELAHAEEVGGLVRTDNSQRNVVAFAHFDPAVLCHGRVVGEFEHNG